MRNKTVVPLVIAVVCGLAASFLITKYGFPKEEDKVPVLRARVDLNPQAKLDKPDEMFEPATISKKEAEAIGANVSFPTDPGKLKDRFLKVSRSKGDYLRDSDLLKEGENPITHKLKKGEVAVAIPADNKTDAGGWLKAGDRVNVVWTKTFNNETKTRTLLRDLEVLAVNDKAQGSADGGIHTKVDYVLLRMEQWKSAAIAKFADSGKLRLMLRGEGDALDSVKKEEEETALKQEIEKGSEVATTTQEPTPAVDTDAIRKELEAKFNEQLDALRKELEAKAAEFAKGTETIKVDPIPAGETVVVAPKYWPAVPVTRVVRQPGAEPRLELAPAIPAPKKPDPTKDDSKKETEDKDTK